MVSAANDTLKREHKAKSKRAPVDEPVHLPKIHEPTYHESIIEWEIYDESVRQYNDR